VSEKALAKYREGGSIDDAGKLGFVRRGFIWLTSISCRSAEWTRIHPKILHLVDSAKSRKRDKDREAKLVECEASRKNSLRKFYDSMIEDLEEDQLPPLFVDYLFLPSVQALWRRLDEDDHREKVKKSEWIVKRDPIEAELEDYHLDVLDKTVRLVLSTTQEYENDDDFESAVGQTLSRDLDDFFSRATSMIFCDAGCETKTWITQSRNITGMGSEATKKVAAFCGTLPEVIEHQLSAHNSYNASKYLSPREKRQSQPQYRFSLPLEVASVVSDLVDLVGSNEASVSVCKLNSLNRGRFRWTNARGRTRFENWLDLVRKCHFIASPSATDSLEVSNRSTESTSSLAKPQEVALLSTCLLPKSTGLLLTTGPPQIRA